MGGIILNGKNLPHTEAQRIRKPQHQELPAFHPPKPHTSPLWGMDIFRESEEWDSKIYTKHTTHEPRIHSKKHRRRRWDGCPFGARPPAPRRHHIPTNVSRQGDGPAGKARHPRRARQHPDTGRDKKHHAAPHFSPTDHTQLCIARRTLPQKLPNATTRHTKRSQKPHNLMIFHPQLLNCVNT